MTESNAFLTPEPNTSLGALPGQRVFEWALYRVQTEIEMSRESPVTEPNNLWQFTHPRHGRTKPKARSKGFLIGITKRIYHIALGDVVRVLGMIALASVPVARSYDRLRSPAWLWGWLGLFLVKAVVWDRYLNGLFAESVSSRVAPIHGAVAGSIDTATQKLVHSVDRRLTEEGSKAVCVALLHRIRDYTEVATQLPRGVQLRVTLAVPLEDVDRTPRGALRVWCYDQPYANRRWSEFPLQLDGTDELVGCPAAFATRSWQIIDDIQRVDSGLDLTDRDYRSVLSIPVMAGGPQGRSLAVVNIDAAEPHFFKQSVVVQNILPLVAPSISTIAMILLTRAEDARYAFGN